MILKGNCNEFDDKELLGAYEKLKSIHKGIKLIEFLLNCKADENGVHNWIGNTQQLARLIGNGGYDDKCSSNFRTSVIQPLINKKIIIKELLKRKTVKYSLSPNWKKFIFS